MTLAFKKQFDLRWALRDIRAKRWKLSLIDPSHLEKLKSMGLFEMRDDDLVLHECRNRRHFLTDWAFMNGKLIARRTAIIIGATFVASAMIYLVVRLRIANDAVVGRQRHDAVEPAAHAVLARRRLSARPGAALRGVVLAEHAGGRLRPTATASAASTTSPSDRWCRTTRSRSASARVAAWPPAWRRPEPARHPGHARLRRRHAVARAAEEGPRLDPVHRRAADGAGLRRLHAGRDQARAQAQGGAELHGHVHERAPIRAADLRDDAERDDEAPGGAVHARERSARCATASGSSGRRCR